MKRMAFRSWSFLALLVSVVAVSGCKDNYDDMDLGRMTATEFVQRAAASDVFEITTGEMAMDMSQTPEVMQFGEMLVDDHTTSSAQLMQIAQANNVNMTMPTAATLPEDKRAIITRLEGKTDVAYDQDFANVQVQAHEEAIALYEEAIDELENAALRTFAQQTLPVLQMHLQHARELREQVGK